ncbi:MAG: hypothetical protein QG560_115 [Campylobacterota bacterium]|nr:hypothetical protein [Campylobacterota bacterium]MDQ1337930.1 hypothetical protein [Campylobacterota bacterium]
MKTVIKKGDKLKIVKSTFFIYCSEDDAQLTKAIYTKAASLLDTDKGFFISSHRSQGEQLSLVCAAHEGIDISKQLQGKLLKNDLERLNRSIIRYFGAIEPAIPSQVRLEHALEDISAYASYVDYAFIEHVSVSSQNDITFLKELQRISKELSMRIEVGVNCNSQWREKISAFASVMGV